MLSIPISRDRGRLSSQLCTASRVYVSAEMSTSHSAKNLREGLAVANRMFRTAKLEMWLDASTECRRGPTGVLGGGKSSSVPERELVSGRECPCRWSHWSAGTRVHL
jgi:hypothetical protein